MCAHQCLMLCNLKLQPSHQRFDVRWAEYTFNLPVYLYLLLFTLKTSFVCISAQGEQMSSTIFAQLNSISHHKTASFLPNTVLISGIMFCNPWMHQLSIICVSVGVHEWPVLTLHLSSHPHVTMLPRPFCYFDSTICLSLSSHLMSPHNSSTLVDS